MYQALAQQEIERCADLCKQAHGFAPVVTVEWDLRGIVAGKCCWAREAYRSTLRLNAHIAAAEGEAYRQTVAHEYAHAVVFSQRQRFLEVHGVLPRGPAWSAHGTRWQATMRLFGCPARRCHSYASAERVVERRLYVYRCQCRDDIRIGAIRHNKARAGTVYRCRRCGVSIVFDHAA